MRIRIGLIVIFSLPGLILFSQKSDNHHFTGLQAHYGFIIPHTSAIEAASHSKPYGLEISFGRLSSSFESWKVFHHYNMSGIQLGYFNFQNPSVTGCAYTLTFFTEPVLSRGEKWIFSVKAGAGFSWQTKLYDYRTDSLNKFFSTHISFPIYLSARFKYRLSPRTFFTLSGNYNHISNGAMKVPNMGMNFPTLSIGVEQFFRSFPEFDEKYTSEGNSRISEHYILFQVLAGYKSVWGEPTRTAGLSARYTWKLRTFYALNGGAEMIFDGGVRKMVEIQSMNVDYKRFAITAGQDFFLGKISFTQYLGVYLYSPYKARQPVYQKYELAYRMKDFLAGVYLKAHTSEAELFGFSLNYILRLR